jgi:hypothetical protein
VSVGHAHEVGMVWIVRGVLHAHCVSTQVYQIRDVCLRGRLIEELVALPRDWKSLSAGYSRRGF